MRTLPIEVPWLRLADNCEHKFWAPEDASMRAGLFHEQRSSEYRSLRSSPKHFFQHWTGRNLVPPLSKLMPVCAMGAQFYMVYIPEEWEAKEDKISVLRRDIP